MSSSPAVDATTPLPTPSPEDGFKVFVGNLSFSTKDSDLEHVFGKVGPIATAVVINRGTRSLGYGFVTYVHEESALTAVQTLDKSEISSRQINVELAKPAAPRAPRAPRAPKAAASPIAEEGEARIDNDVEAPVARAKKPRAKRPKASRQPRTDGETEEAGDAPVAALTDNLAAATLDGAPAARAPRAPRAPKSVVPRRIGPPTGTPSTTLLFVANLAFSVTDEMLLAVFDGYKVKSARIVTKKFGNERGRSKGFGFVELETESEQVRALEGVQGKEVEGREMQLKIAINPEEEVAVAGEAVEPEAIIVAS